jgi:hypothetical protein
MLISACIGTKSSSVTGEQESDVFKFSLSKSNYTILKFKSDWHWIFKNVEPTNLSKSELTQIEEILEKAIVKHNKKQEKNLKEHNQKHPKNQWTETGFELKLDGFKRQYVPVIDENNEKIVWINFFCDDLGSNAWKKNLFRVVMGHFY